MRHLCTAILLATLVACGGGQGVTSPSTSLPPSTPPTPVAPPVTTTAGCGSGAKFATGLQSLTSDSTQRSYWIEMPANYDRNKAYPVIIGLHWRDGSAK